MKWKPDRAAAFTSLDDFLSRAKSYAQERNFDRGPGDRRNVSQLSPFLRYRLLTEEEVWEETLKRHSFSSVEKFLQEVVWRTYWKGWMERRPGVWEQWVAALKRLEEVPGLAEAREGKTGIEPFDVWAKELVETNYLHNHARMWFASIWIFTLQLPWEAGADFFLENLLDGDPASNTLGWRWVGGLQTRGKHYVARAENIRRFTEGRLDPGTQLNEDAEPLPLGAPPEKIDPVLPPLVSEDPPKKEDGLFLATDDLAPETMFDRGVFASIAGGRPEVNDRAPLREAARVSEFRSGAIRSTLERIEDRSGAKGHWIPDGDAADVLRWARDSGVRRVWLAHAPVGPTRCPLQKLANDLEESGIGVRWYARKWDQDLHPFAKSGFFAFRKKAFPFLCGSS